MKPIYDDVNYALNDKGEFSVNFHIKQAHQLRSKVLRSYSSKAIKSVKAGIGYLLTLGHNPKAA